MYAPRDFILKLDLVCVKDEALLNGEKADLHFVYDTCRLEERFPWTLLGRYFGNAISWLMKLLDNKIQPRGPETLLLDTLSLGRWPTEIQHDACDCPGGQRLHQSPLPGADMGSLIRLHHLQPRGLAGTSGVKQQFVQQPPASRHIEDLLHVLLVLLLHANAPHPHPQRPPVPQPHPDILEEPDGDRGSLRGADVPHCRRGFPLHRRRGSPAGDAAPGGGRRGLVRHLPRLHLRVLRSPRPSPRTKRLHEQHARSPQAGPSLGRLYCDPPGRGGGLWTAGLCSQLAAVGFRRIVRRLFSHVSSHTCGDIRRLCWPMFSTF